MKPPDVGGFLFDIYYVYYSIKYKHMAIISETINGKMIDVIINSSNLKTASFNTETEDLTVTFNNGAIYEYNKVPWNKFTKFRLAESQGKYFNENIARSHKFTKKG
jgi:hypothetical protein